MLDHIPEEDTIMLRSSKFALMLGVAGALVALPSLATAQTGEEKGGVQEAIRFEKAKQAAADRQARIEEGRGSESQSADRAAESKAKPTAARKTKSASAQKPAPLPQK
jgi:hypothetical protein